MDPWEERAMRAGLTRRRVLQLAAAAGATAALPFPLRAAAAGPATEEYDDGNAAVPGRLAGEPERVIIVGAGFAGLTAANALRNAGIECVVLEGRRRLGGRARTKDVGGHPVDLGCSWIHEPIGNPMTQYAQQAGVGTVSADIEADAALIRFFDGFTGETVLATDLIAAFSHVVRFDEDASAISTKLGPGASARDGVKFYLEREGLTGNPRRRAEFLLRLVLQQTDAIDWRRLSLDYIANFDTVYTGVGEGNFPTGGYIGLVEAMAGDTDVRLGQRVERISHGASGVRVQAHERGSDRRRTFRGSHALVTVPLGVLQHGAIEFSPALPNRKREAIRSLWAGHFEKVALTFDEAFWEDDLKTHILHLSERVPLEFPLFLDLQRISSFPTLVGLCSAKFARNTYRRPDHEVLEMVLAVLEKVLGRAVPAPQAHALTHWRRDPFSRGSYTSVPVGASLDACDEIAKPVHGRVLFAGEASNRARIGYSDGALSSGVREAKRMLQQPSVQLSAG